MIIQDIGLSADPPCDPGSGGTCTNSAWSGAVAGLQADLPGIEVRVIADEAALVEGAIDDVEQAALLGITLAILVLALFLRSPGPTVIVATAVPVSLLATLFLMHFGGQSLNVMTLGGLALGAGMLVDNAIVVVESIYRRLTRAGGGYTVAGMGMIICGFGMSVVLQNIAFLIWGAAIRLVASRMTG